MDTWREQNTRVRHYRIPGHEITRRETEIFDGKKNREALSWLCVRFRRVIEVADFGRDLILSFEGWIVDWWVGSRAAVRG